MNSWSRFRAIFKETGMGANSSILTPGTWGKTKNMYMSRAISIPVKEKYTYKHSIISTSYHMVCMLTNTNLCIQYLVAYLVGVYLHSVAHIARKKILYVSCAKGMKLLPSEYVLYHSTYICEKVYVLCKMYMSYAKCICLMHLV